MDCKQRSRTLSNKAPTVSREASSKENNRQKCVPCWAGSWFVGAGVLHNFGADFFFLGSIFQRNGMFKTGFCADFWCTDFCADFCVHFWCEDFCADFVQIFGVELRRFLRRSSSTFWCLKSRCSGVMQKICGTASQCPAWERTIFHLRFLEPKASFSTSQYGSARQHQGNLDVTSDVVLSCCCFPSAGADKSAKYPLCEPLASTLPTLSPLIKGGGPPP